MAHYDYKVAFISATPCQFCGTRQQFLRSLTPHGAPARPRPARRPARPRMAADRESEPFNEPPKGTVITKALEISFRNVWIRLMTAGVGPEYEDAIQTFVVASVAAYKAGYSLNALKLELSANEAAATYMGRDTSLNEKEKETRLIWVTLVYLTLMRCGFQSDKPHTPIYTDLKGSKMEPILNGLTGLVDSVCEAAKKGYTLQTFKMELSLKAQPDTEKMSSAQASIRSQWSRIIFSTVKILPDSLLGNPRGL